eukprot:3489947-Amphidinium_carterae.1
MAAPPRRSKVDGPGRAITNSHSAFETKSDCHRFATAAAAAVVVLTLVLVLVVVKGQRCI